MSDPKYRYPYPPPQQGYNYYQGSVMDFRPQYPQQAYPQYPQQAYQYFLPGNTPPNNKKTRKRDKILPLVALIAGPAVVHMVEGAIDMVNTSYSDLDYDLYQY